MVGLSSSHASVFEQERREARVQATYLTHLVNFTRWSKDHLPPQGQAPTILVVGDESSGFIASFEYLIKQSDVRIAGKKARFLRFDNAKLDFAKSTLRAGCQVTIVMPNSKLSVEEIRKLSPSSVIFGFGREFTIKQGGDVAFISSKNRVKLCLSDLYFRRTSPKLSAKIANLKSVVEIVASPRKDTN